MSQGSAAPPTDLQEAAAKPELEYNAHLEDLISSEAEKALVLRWLHNRAELQYSKFNTWITLPVITISTLAGTASIGSDTLFGNSAAAPVLIGMMSLVVSILNVVASFFGWAKRAEGHRISSINYGKMHRWISIELALPREQRMPAKHFLKEIRQQIDRFNETSPQIPRPLIGEFRLAVKDLKDDVSLPEICDEIKCVVAYPGEIHHRGPAAEAVAAEDALRLTEAPEKEAAPTTGTVSATELFQAVRKFGPALGLAPAKQNHIEKD